ncbi:MAG: hypothetical protein EZS28_020048 [Streblomastix strix]|uniref:Uncharacterized protein n=1 Tax=Streblomastix strix TaxID=222440 RepID=A0A5J4VQ85_9EUKA|nr:MAG: hypothetical protein EZS28_020048 [Streblomastix strix]
MLLFRIFISLLSISFEPSSFSSSNDSLQSSESEYSYFIISFIYSTVSINVSILIYCYFNQFSNSPTLLLRVNSSFFSYSVIEAIVDNEQEEEEDDDDDEDYGDDDEDYGEDDEEDEEVEYEYDCDEDNDEDCIDEDGQSLDV